MIKIFMLFLFVFLFTLPSNAESQVVCLVSNVSGQAMLVSTTGERHEIINFEKISSAEKIELLQGSKIRLCFLRNGRVEEWAGTANLIIQEQFGQDLSKKQKAIVEEYGEVKSKLNESKLLKTQSEIVGGQVAVRNLVKDSQLGQKEREELDEINRNYSMLASKLPDGDYTADIFYISGLEHLGQKASMYKHLKKIQKKEMGNKAIEKIINDVVSTN